MRQGRGYATYGRAAALGTAVIVLLGACSSGSGAALPTGSGSPAAPGSAGASSPAAAFVVPTTGCVLSAQSVAGITGDSGVVTGDLPGAPTNSAGAPEGCEYLSAGNLVAIIGVIVDPAQSGESAQQYLSSDIGSDNTYGVSQAVPGLGDAAEFGTASCSAGTCGAVLVVQIRGGTVAHVTVAASSPSEGPVLSLARAVLAALSS
jgi:hypothetical protein